MKKCKFCMTEIDKNAKVCPNCKKDLRNWGNRHPIITIILSLFLLGSIINSMSEIINNPEQSTITENNQYVNQNGIWEIGYYTDDFGDKTNDSVITNTEYIKGTFSNTATENSSLSVKFLIDSKDSISIKLFEYSKVSPVKTLGYESYKVSIKDKDGTITDLTASNSSDRLQVKNSKKLYDILLKGGNIKFAINGDSSSYNFSFNADGFEKIVKEKK